MTKNLKTIIFLVLIIIILIVAGFFLVKIKEDENLRSVENKMIYFYGEGCPHCANVEQFLKENDVASKIKFEEKEIYFDKGNANLLILIAKKKCGLEESEIGIPFLWDKGECIVGDKPIIDNFREKLEI